MSERRAFLSSPRLWTTISSLAGKAAGRNWVAVPYVGPGAANQLRLRRGDVLLSALTKQNCRTGAVCPAALRAFRDRGVRLYQQADLHAKVYLLGSTLIVTSANLSGAARDALDEAGAVSTERKCVQDARAWFRVRLTQPVTPKWLEECERVYRPPRGPRGGRKPQPGAKTPAMRVWLMRLSSVDPPANEQDIRDAGEAVARERKAPGTTIEWIRFAGTPQFLARLSDGDAIVQVWKEDGRAEVEVCASARLLHHRTRRGRTRRFVYLFIEEPAGCRRLKWAAFKKACSEHGLRVRQPASVREIRGARSQRALLSIVSPERLTKR